MNSITQFFIKKGNILCSAQKKILHWQSSITCNNHSSSYSNAIIYCIDEKQYTNYLAKFILFDSDTLTLRTDDDMNEDLASVILDSQSLREYFSSSEYQDFKEIL